jgi:hypothetical protein
MNFGSGENHRFAPGSQPDASQPFSTFIVGSACLVRLFDTVFAPGGAGGVGGAVSGQDWQ